MSIRANPCPIIWLRPQAALWYSSSGAAVISAGRIRGVGENVERDGATAMAAEGVFRHQDGHADRSTSASPAIAPTTTGAACVQWYGAAQVSNSTFSGNSDTNGRVIYNYNSEGTVTTLQTPLSPTAQREATAPVPLPTADGNLSHPDTACPGINGDPKLGSLQDNGGPTWTLAPLPGSAAIDAADDAICAAAPVNNLDQHGITRPQGAHCDIGAYEALPPHARFLPIVVIQRTANRPRSPDRGRHGAIEANFVTRFRLKRCILQAALHPRTDLCCVDLFQLTCSQQKGDQTMRPKHLVTLLVLLAFAAATAPTPAHAGGIVSVCDEAHLLAALADGGTVTFSCSGTITLTATIRSRLTRPSTAAGRPSPSAATMYGPRVPCELRDYAQPE